MRNCYINEMPRLENQLFLKSKSLHIIQDLFRSIPYMDNRYLHCHLSPPFPPWNHVTITSSSPNMSLASLHTLLPLPKTLIACLPSVHSSRVHLNVIFSRKPWIRLGVLLVCSRISGVKWTIPVTLLHQTSPNPFPLRISYLTQFSMSNTWHRGWHRAGLMNVCWMDELIN